MGGNTVEIELWETGERSGDREWFERRLLEYFSELAQYDPDYNRLLDRIRERPGLLQVMYKRPWTTNHIIGLNGGRAGLMVVADGPGPNVTMGCDHRLGEFYILPRFRRRGLGRQAALHIFQGNPGRWEVTQIPSNSAAIAFWLGVIEELTGGEFEDEESSARRRQVFCC